MYDLNLNSLSPQLIKRWESRKICVICEQEEVNAYIVPCGHAHFCANCIAKLPTNKSGQKKCCTCNTFISRVSKLYLP